MSAACRALDIPRSTGYRWRFGPVFGPRRPRPSPARALSELECQDVLSVLYSERFVDQAPRTVCAKLLDEDQRYLCSPRTMYRLLQAQNAAPERRAVRSHPTYKKPELLATGPNQVWTWDVTWLRGPVRYKYYPLYVIIDLYSRLNPGWLLAHEENGEHAARLIEETCKRQGVERNSLTVHADRGPVPTGKTVNQLFIDMDIAPSFSRPRVSNDNPFSEAQFRTMKYGPEYPDRFAGYDDARNFCKKFFPWYNNDHRHSGIAYFTPADVHYGRVQMLLAQRQTAMNKAYERTPERFPNGAPKVKKPPSAVWINPPENRSEIEFGLHLAH
jgi:putative transposase